MAIGTAGFTAMLALMAIERHDLTPSAGAALVTGAAGGVGSMAISLFADKGWRVIASTGRASEAAYLKSLGADEIIDRATLSAPASRSARSNGRPRSTASARRRSPTCWRRPATAARSPPAVWPAGMDLPAAVAPFILRGVSLLGIDSVHCPTARRLEAWRRLALDLDRVKLAAMTETIPLAQVFEAGARILKGETRGRLVVTIP